LSTVDRLNNLNSDLDTLADRADRDNLRAGAARSHAEQAMAAAVELPLDEARAELDAAQQAVSAASAVLDSLRVAGAAATSIVALPLVPTDDGRLSDQAWTAPGTGPITDGFGLRPDRPAGAGPFHYAIDIGTGCNAWIVAAAAGTVSASGPYGGLGNRVVIDHGDGITTTYAHIADGGLAVTPGQLVAAGEAIALSGSTGVSTGCHLHFEVALDGVRTDPLPFLAARGVAVG
ncbi:M23 family metallopeptidase, partial [Kitasatospora indigofera]|uniref:M23 family metallopeptidase n=1 Tax=Kitasatospora indigofera TaxID=67307 RepID=UPI00368C67DF